MRLTEWQETLDVQATVRADPIEDDGQARR
jgi:hypothetical protein